MKYKINADIHKMGEHTETILRVVANNNSGQRDVDLRSVQCYLLVRESIYPIINCDLGYVLNQNTIRVSNDKGKTFSLTLEWVEIEENNDIPDTMFASSLANKAIDELNKGEV